MSRRQNMRYVVTGGGTGGHIYPALAIAKTIMKHQSDAEILYIGTKHGLESEIVPREGFEFKTIRIQGFRRKLSRDTFKSACMIFRGMKDAKRILKEFKPDIVIGTGGYVCGPVVYQASRLKIPTVIHESNAFPGITNKILAKKVDKILVSFDEANKRFKRPERTVLTGNPIREDFLKVTDEEANRVIDKIAGKKLIFSFGGSGGQKSINLAILDLIERFNDSKYQLIHVTGKNRYEDFMRLVDDKNIKVNSQVKILPYMYAMPEVMKLSDLVIISAGALGISEVTALGVPAIVIPKSYTTENHQEYNARVIEENGAGRMILESDLSSDKLWKIINQILVDEKGYTKMVENSLKLSEVDATEQIYKEIESMI
jgi:UDP-N-acetylglucosamine--N-acetylmuramyl-(pentapeptide) pyrophosphoryl-undecaprenol N-acetylglucosamine transferase